MLINDILDLSRIESGRVELQPSEFRLPEFLDEIEHIIRTRCLEKGLLLTGSYADSLPVAIETDELRLRQILLHLLSNAVKFTEHGHCTFTIDSKILEEKSVRLLISISDSGPGIAPETQEQIFEPFQQTGERLKYAKGSGLGLPISRKIIELMGGTLQLSSPVNDQPKNGEGAGSRFFFSIDVKLVSAARTDHSESEKRHTEKTAAELLNGEEEVPFPPREILANLVRLTRGGYVDAMMEQAQALSTMEAGKYQKFADRIILLAKNFQLDELEAFITRSQKTPPND